MKIAVITDAHANLPALEAALRGIDREGCDLLVHTGDAIGIGPHPREVLDVLLSRPDTQLLMGNHDEWFAHGLPEPQPSWMSHEEVEHQGWVHAQFDRAQRVAVAGWPFALELDLGPLTVTFCHYPRLADGSRFADIVREPVSADLDRLFGGNRSGVIFYGHHHPVSDLQGRARYVNPGALGCSTEAMARYAILDITANGTWEIHLRSEPYDRSGLVAEYERRHIPARSTILRIFHGQSV